MLSSYKIKLFIICILSLNIVNSTLKSFDLQSELIDLTWCGNNNEIIFALTKTNVLFRIQDKDFSSKNLNDDLEKLGIAKLSLNNTPDEVNKIFIKKGRNCQKNNY